MQPARQKAFIPVLFHQQTTARVQCGGEYDQALDHAETIWPVLDSFTLYCRRRHVLGKQPEQTF